MNTETITKTEIKVYYGIFKISDKQPMPVNMYSAIHFTSTNNEMVLERAHDVALETEEDAVQLIPSLPKPALYTVLPVYANI